QESHSTDNISGSHHDPHSHSYKHLQRFPLIFGTQTTTNTIATSAILSPPLLPSPPLPPTTSTTLRQYESTNSQQQQSQLQSPLQPFTTSSSPPRSLSRNRQQYNSNFNQTTISPIATPTLNPTPISATTTATDISNDSDVSHINKQIYDGKRAMRLERNRVAAKECRERKKSYILNLESKATRLEQENANLHRMVQEMKNKLDWVEIKTAENVQLQLLVQDLKCRINEMQKCSINGGVNNIGSSNGFEGNVVKW
ncbi:14127_t:CDS:1, partial [Entrophospora sp. SA101]